MEYTTKISEANKILKNLKRELLHILTESDSAQYCHPKLILPWLEEESEYAIKRLKLTDTDETRYLMKVTRIFGVYSENLPLLKRKRKKRKRD